MKTWMVVFSAMIFSAVVEVSAQAAPPAPTPTAPAQNALSVSVTPNLVWNASTGATSYQVEVATDSLFTALIVDDSTVATTTREVGPLTNATVYYWRVRAKGTGGTSAYSARQSFTTIVAVPATPALTAPANNAVNVAISTTLTWGAAARATSYHVQIGTDSTFATTTVNDSTDTTNSLPVTLFNGNTYYWHVSAKDTAGVSAYSTRRNFNTYPDSTPAVPTLTTPAQAATNVADSIAFIWAAANGATSYGIQVSTDSNFASTFLINDSGLTNDTLSVKTLVTGNTYYWRVNSKNAFGTSAYSTRRNFTTVSAVPVAPTLTAPANAATNQADSVAFTWAAAAGAISYHIQISTDSNFATTFVANDSGLTVLTLSVNTLTTGNTYYWRVSAKNTFGAGAYSARRSFSTVSAVPAAPTLTAPANAATNQADSVAFTWAAAAGAISYHIQISTDSNFATTFVANDSGLTVLTLSVNTLTAGNTYYWRVSAKNTFGAGAYSARRSFSTLPAAAPAAPVLNTPAEAAANVAVSSNLTWTASTGATSYRVQVSTDSTFSSTFVVNDSGLTAVTLAIGPLANATTYYWRVNAKNSFGTSAFAAFRNFTTVALAAPGAPTLTAPANNATNVAISTNLTWNAVAVASTYHVQFGTDSTFTTNTIDDSVLTKDTLAVGPLPNGVLYYWHVSAKNAAGTSAYSARRDFTTVNEVPSAPTLSSPAQNATGVAMPATLVWNASTGAVSYQVEVSKDSTFATTAVDDSAVTATSQLISLPNDGSIYYWRVNAMNNLGTSDYSVREKFTVVVAPSAPTLTAPANNATGVALTTNLTWTASAGATSYLVQLSTDSTFGSTLVDDSTVTTATRAVGPLPGNTIYYWRVSARNAAGSSAFSPRWSYSTKLGVPTAPVLSSPAQGATNVTLSSGNQGATLTWVATTGAASYRLQVSTDSTFSSTFAINDSGITGVTLVAGPLATSTQYYWRVNAKDSLGTSSYSAVRSFTTTSVVGILPQGFSLERLSASNSGALQFALPAKSHVDITLFDSQGRMQQKLLDGDRDAGYYTIPLPAAKLSGAYFLDFRADGFHKTLMLNF